MAVVELEVVAVVASAVSQGKPLPVAQACALSALLPLAKGMLFAQMFLAVHQNGHVGKLELQIMAC